MKMTRMMPMMMLMITTNYARLCRAFHVQLSQSRRYHHHRVIIRNNSHDDSRMNASHNQDVVIALLDEDKNDVTRTQSVSTSIPANPVGIIFDMDGTLIKPCIDFKEMRRQIYAIADSCEETFGLRGDVLELCDTNSSFSKEQKIRAKEVFAEIERKAILDMEIMDDVTDLLHFLDDCRIKRAVLTRNVQTSVVAMEEMIHKSTKTVLQDRFYPVVARDSIVTFSDNEDGILPPKPEPDAILYICQQWKCHPTDVIMVGDSVADDVAAANRAGCASVLLDTGKDNDSGRENANTDDEIEEQTPSTIVLSHKEFLTILQSMSMR